MTVTLVSSITNAKMKYHSHINLQQHEITRNQLSNFSQMPNAAESLQMTMNPYLMGGSINNIKQTFNGFHRNRP